MNYFLVSQIVLVIVMGTYVCMQYDPSWLRWVELVLLIAITWAGIYTCFAINRKGDNKEFIDRFVCIGWPVGIKIFLLTLLVGFVSVSVRTAYLLPSPPTEPVLPATTTMDAGALERERMILQESIRENEEWMHMADEFFSTSTVLDVAIICFLTILLYWRIAWHMKKIAGVHSAA